MLPVGGINFWLLLVVLGQGLETKDLSHGLVSREAFSSAASACNSCMFKIYYMDNLFILTQSKQLQEVTIIIILLIE